MERRYQILAPAGQGGMGTVYRARLLADGGFEKIVALKILEERVNDDADLSRRLRDEARILARLKHRAIVSVDGLIRLNGRWTVAMEFVEGVDLLQAAAKRGKLPAAAVVDLVQEVASALHHAHTATAPDGSPLRLVHRDLKPANLRVTPGGDVKVLDFGVARAQFAGREAETRAGGFGSIGYVPPERVDGDELPAGDIYALGIVAFELLSGKKFGPGHLVEKRHAALVEERLALLDAVADPLRQLLRGMMAFDPERRPSARDVERRASELLPALQGSQRLREWAEENVPAIAAEVNAGLATDPLVGQVFPEEGGDISGPRPIVPPPAPAPEPEPAPPPAPVAAPPPEPRRSWVSVLLLILLVLVALVVAPLVLLVVAAGGVWIGTLI